VSLNATAATDDDDDDDEPKRLLDSSSSSPSAAASRLEQLHACLKPEVSEPSAMTVTKASSTPDTKPDAEANPDPSNSSRT
jgi:hypothetical protein